MKQKISVDIVSDVVCPWCYIGKRRLEKAMQELGDEYEFEVTYHPFELNPQMPSSGVNQQEYLSQKFGSVDKYEQLTTHVSSIALAEGLQFDFLRQRVSPNTRKAHSILQYAKARGQQLSLMELLFKAYFTDGKDLSKDDVLIEISEEAGLEKSEVIKLLADENALLQVALEEQEMYKLGITGVPFYIINKRYGISGAQSSDTFMDAFREVGKVATTDENACSVDNPNC